MESTQPERDGEKNPHNLLGGVYTRSEFIHTYYDEGTRILKREIKGKHFLGLLRGSSSGGDTSPCDSIITTPWVVSTRSQLFYIIVHIFFLYDSSSLMPPSPATLTLSLTCMDRYYLIAPKQTTPPFDPCPVNMW